MTYQQTAPLILIYYKIRGKMQVIRNILCHLQLTFTQIFLQTIQESDIQLPTSIKTALKHIRVDKARVPLLVHSQRQIYGIYPIISYLCQLTGNLDLLGCDAIQQAQVQSIVHTLIQKQMKCKSDIFELAQHCLDKGQHQLRQQLSAAYTDIMLHSGYVGQLCQLLSFSASGFILGTMTIIDFYFFQSCNYILGVFGRLDESFQLIDGQIQMQDQLVHELSGSWQMANLSVMRLFRARMQSLQFYSANHQYLQSFSLVYSNTSRTRAIGLRKIWTGDRHLVQ